MRHQATFADIAPLILPGDIIAFSSRGIWASIIKRVTRSAVSHNGIVLESGRMLQSIAPQGVIVSDLAEVVAKHRGELWWLPLSSASRAKLDEPAMQAFLRTTVGKKYDYAQAAGAGLDWIVGLIFRVGENLTKLFCSEVAAAAHERGGLYACNASEVTPADLAYFAIYGPDYYQLRGEPREIKGFNRVNPEGFGQ